jgi:hypothetical protein
MERAARERDRCWNHLDNYTLKTVMERMNQTGIWVPEGGGDNVG